MTSTRGNDADLPITFRTALVTGASGGLGAAIARQLDRAGFAVALHCLRNPELAEKVAEDLTNPSKVVVADLRSWPEVTAMCEAAEQDLGPISVLVNSAGIRNDGLLAGQSPDDWRDVIDVNLIGTFHTCRALVPTMLRNRRGCIVNIVSPSGTQGSEGQTAYSASKAGVVGLTRSLARECGRRRVTVNALSPGYMETAMTTSLGDDAKAAITARIPLRRHTTPDEVANAITFIVDSPYMTGQVITIDGGMTA
jgi:3-oxoacyl-[acyl-carrier protein] reductase